MLDAGAISFGTTYTNSPSGDAALDGLIDEVGAFDGIDPLAGAEFLVFSVRFTAKSAGSVNFVGDAADATPDHDLLVYGSTVPLGTSEVDYGSAGITISAQPPQPITQIIDDGESGYSRTGSWTDFAGQGRDNDLDYSEADTGADLATWSFTVTPARYRVSATWNPFSNRATDAPYTI